MFIGSPRYVIPAYQRPYSWEPKQTKRFLSDLETTHHLNEKNDDYKHFFGFMITMDSDSLPQDSIKFIDGQQRMTTVILFLICARNFFYKHSQNSPFDLGKYVNRIDQLIFSSIDNHDREKSVPTLTLSRPNRDFFNMLVFDNNITNKQLKVHSAKIKTNDFLADAYIKFHYWFSRKPRTNSDDYSKIFKYVITLLSKFTIYRSSYTDKKEAQRIFNLVNNRGRQLGESDLIKNYLFTELDDLGNVNIDNYDKIWNKILINVTNEKTNFKPDLFFHHYLIVSRGYDLRGIKPDKKKMYETIEHLVTDKKRGPKEIIDGLLHWSKILCKVRNPIGENEFKNHANIIYYLSKMRTMDVKFDYPAILIGYEIYWQSHNIVWFEILLALCFKYHLRVKVLGEIKTDKYECAINENIVANIYQGKKLDAIITDITTHASYISDTILRDKLKDKTLTMPSIITSLLEEIEWEGHKRKSLDSVSIEHIMPKKLNSDWKNYIVEHHKINLTDPKRTNDEIKNIHDRYVNYLGNQTLLEQSANQSISNSAFDTKQDKYSTSNYNITQALKDLQVWDTQAIIDRQKLFAESLLRTLDLTILLDMFGDS